MEYETMTRNGIFGATIQAQSDEEATTQAKEYGYSVIEVIDGTDHCTDADFILVVE
jgi:hypothetical protein